MGCLPFQAAVESVKGESRSARCCFPSKGGGKRRTPATVSATNDESAAAAKVLTLFGGGGNWVLCEGLVQEGRADPVKGIFSSSSFLSESVTK
jgi:hypothetical protein